MLRNFVKPGRASFIVGGQWGSEAKGAAAAWVAENLIEQEAGDFTLYTTNAGAQAGHTSIVNGEKIVLFHLPTAAVVRYKRTGVAAPVLINAGAVIDREVLFEEIGRHYRRDAVMIHPMATVITDEDKRDSNDPESKNTKIAGVRKGVGHAIARKTLRTAATAKDYQALHQFVQRSYDGANNELERGGAVLVEIPQGTSLSLNHSGFYPYTTSRDCTVMQAMNDACIHPKFYHKTMTVLRTFPIRVGNITSTNGERIGYSGNCYDDQVETTWEALGVKPEITTVSKRVRRVFEWSNEQLRDTWRLTHPDVVFLTFANYCTVEQLLSIFVSIDLLRGSNLNCQFFVQWGPASDCVQEVPSDPRERISLANRLQRYNDARA